LALLAIDPGPHPPLALPGEFLRQSPQHVKQKVQGLGVPGHLRARCSRRRSGKMPRDLYSIRGVGTPVVGPGALGARQREPGTASRRVSESVHDASSQSPGPSGRRRR
jgi:hypothetical protein